MILPTKYRGGLEKILGRYAGVGGCRKGKKRKISSTENIFSSLENLLVYDKCFIILIKSKNYSN